MLTFEKPLFLTNKEWYYHDDKINKFFLTDKAPEEAQKKCDDWWDNVTNWNMSAVSNLIKSLSWKKEFFWCKF